MKAWVWVLIVGFVGTVALCVGSVYLIDYYAADQTTTHLAKMGTIGDMFGLVAALFAGLGFVGLTAALVFDAHKRSEDLEDRRRARLPFIVASIEDQGAAIDRAERPRGRLEVDLRITVKLENLTAEPALDLALSGTVLSGAAGVQIESEVADSPLGPERSRDGYVTLLFKGDDATNVIRQLKAQQVPVVIRLTATYSSLSGAGWKSQVDFKLTATTDEEDDLASIADPAANYTITPPGSGSETIGANPLFLQSFPLPGTWEQGKYTAPKSGSSKTKEAPVTPGVR